MSADQRHSTSQAELGEQFRNNLGRDLHFVSRELERALMQNSVARGHQGLKLNWDTVFLNLDFQHGSRLVDLAQINGLTKQGMSQIVAEIEAQGYVEKKDDPSDGRAKKIVLTAKGRKLVRDSMAAQQQIEQQYAQLIGNEKLDTLRELLGELAQALRISGTQPD